MKKLFLTLFGFMAIASAFNAFCVQDKVTPGASVAGKREINFAGIGDPAVLQRCMAYPICGEKFHDIGTLAVSVFTRIGGSAISAALQRPSGQSSVKCTSANFLGNIEDEVVIPCGHHQREAVGPVEAFVDQLPGRLDSEKANCKGAVRRFLGA